jgi:GR25 family glycosyltransferase involved in LPS biosynthesis
MKIFIIHYKKLVDRKNNIINQFKNHNITDFEFIEIDRDELQNENTSIFENSFPSHQQAIFLSHFYAYKEIALKYDHGLIFEDDVILEDNFVDKLEKYLSQLPPTYDMFFISNGCNFHIPSEELVENKFVYKKCLQPTCWGGGGVTRCCDGYIVTKKCANNICNYIFNYKNKINNEIDWFLNKAAMYLRLKVYWAEPTICYQGTENGIFDTSY